MYKSEDDYWRLRAFLREVFLLNDCYELSWQTARLDYWHYFGNEQFESYELNKAICLWETDDGRIAAFVTPESRGHAYLQVHPHFRTPELEADLLKAAEIHIAEPDGVGKRHLTVWAHQTDKYRIKILEKQGYTPGDWPEYQFRRSLTEEIPDMRVPPGYTIRSLGDASEIPARSWLSWRAFHPDEPDENYKGWQWYRDIQRCPMYRRDLDLVAVALDGELVAFCTVWYDDVTRTGYFEPVGTSPDYQRRGLGRAIMTEGLRRLKRMGALYATVAGYSEAAIGLYRSVMSPEAMLYERWQKSVWRSYEIKTQRSGGY
jgi:ribosomal protein S18 acetylase RimI-like enzyme